MYKFKDLKQKHRALRDGYEDSFSIRIHRSLSWLNRSEKETKDIDAKFIFLKTLFEKNLIFSHLLNVFCVILAFISTSGIDLLFILKNILGQISDSIKIAMEGCQKFKNLFVKYVESIGKN